MTKYGFWLVIRFDEPVILSANNSTAGDHRTLDHVPGSALLGIAASRLYRTLEDDTLRYDVFHGGKASFGNAYPVGTKGETSLPSPLSVHSPKAWPKEKEAERPFVNLAFHKAGEGLGQLEQVRGKFLTATGDSIAPKGRLSLRTAIDPRTGTAAESQLFSYSHLPAGSLFAAWIDAESETVADLLRKTLSGPARLGRSRSAEFGQCTLTVLDDGRQQPETGATDGFALVYCASDVALRDELGFPTREPTAQQFGLKSGWVDWTRTHIRSRRYSPFNAAFRTYETERIVIEKGSVITFNCPGEQVGGADTRVGLYQSAGLGRVLINPTFLLDENFIGIGTQVISLSDEVTERNNRRSRIPASAHMAALFKLRTSGSTGAAEWAEAFRPSLTALYQTARAMNGAASGTPVGPSKAQWGRVDALARTVSNKQALLDSLNKNNVFGKTKIKSNGERGAFVPDPTWGTLGELEANFLSFADWFPKAMAGELANTSAADSMDQIRALIRIAQAVAGAQNRSKVLDREFGA